MANPRDLQPPMAFDVSPVDAHGSHARPGLGIVVGLIAGLAGTWVMSRFAAPRVDVPRPSHDGDRWRVAPRDPLSDLASDVARVVLGRELPEAAEPAASATLRYVFGALAGALYGAAAESDPQVTHGFGAAFGTAAWGFVAGQGGATAERASLTDGDATPDPSALLPGAVYGITTEIARRALRALPLRA